MASRLPRLHPSPPSPPPAKRKRKVSDEENYEIEALDKPRKLPAIGIGRPSRPLKPSLTSSNLPKSLPLPKPLTKPQPPRLTRSTTVASKARETSVHFPIDLPAIPSSQVRSKVTLRSVPCSRPPASVSANEDKRFFSLETKLSSIESLHREEAARFAQHMDAEHAKLAELHAGQTALTQELSAARAHENEQRRALVSASEEVEALKRKHAREISKYEADLRERDREVGKLEGEIKAAREELLRVREEGNIREEAVRQQIEERVILQAEGKALQAQLDTYMRMMEDMRVHAQNAESRMQEMRLEAMEGELVRRKLHNMVQELKGNIRVFVRMRPVLPSDPDETAPISFPDQCEEKEINLESSSESATGQERRELHSFVFDRVFQPAATQGEVFEEISMLVQSCVDGYNVCIFAYGQTGSGKSFTMEGGSTYETTGMIPRAVEQVFRVAGDLKKKGWEYSMEGQFLEIYNEAINDLLGKHDFDKKKHEIKHDLKTGVTRVTDINIVALHSASQVQGLLGIAQRRRTVAATMVNERSSRSHSVFTLRIKGTNASNGEKCEGSLNLVDLAGSERLNVSFANGADKERLKETQNINRSLSALGDVISALGERGMGGSGAETKHIPYRNSKLTYLLQNSLSGNSKTLMFLNLSPLAAHLQESLTSLRFATKVNNTNIGIARKQSRQS